MYKNIILILIALVLIPTVAAELTRLDIPIYVDFISDSEFTLIWDGGVRNFRWDNNSYPGDVNFTAVVYRDLDATVVCSDQESRFRNLTTSMVDMVIVCQELADNNNVSMAMEYADAKYSQGLQVAKLEACNNLLTIAQSQANLYSGCEADRSLLRPKLANCTASVTTTAASSKAGYVVVGLLAFGAGWVAFGRKKGIQEEIKDEGFEAY